MRVCLLFFGVALEKIGFIENWEVTMSRFTLLTVCLVCLNLFGSAIYAQQAEYQYPLDFGIDNTSDIISVGYNEFVFWITPYWVEGQYFIKIQGINGLAVLSESRFTFNGVIEKREEFAIEVNIPDYDTSAILVEICRGDESKRMSGFERWFVTTGDTVEVYNAKPVRGHKNRENWPSNEEIANLHEQDRIKRDRIKNDPTYRGEHLKKTKISLTKREKMELMEQSPLKTHSVQFITVDGISYRRDYGEYKFRESKVIDNIVPNIDSLNNYYQEHADELTKHIVIDLREPKDYDFVKNLCPDIKEMERKGYYEGTLTLRQIELIFEKGLKAERYPRYPGDPSPGQLDRQNKLKKQQDDKHINNETDESPKEPHYLFEYYFEEPIDTSIWHMYDYNAINGYDYWGYVDESVGRVSDGYGSAWCAGIGDQIQCFQYDNNMNAAMYLAEPIDVSAFDQYEFCYSYYLDSEFDYDFMWVLLYRDNIGWACIDSISGFHDGLLDGINIILDNSDFATQEMSLNFRFKSDEAFNTYEGGYIDGVEVWGNSPRPDLFPAGGSGWLNPIIVSSEPDNHTSSAIYNNQTSYIDISVGNGGDWEGIAGPFSVALFLDDIPQPIEVLTWTDSLPYGEYATFDDIEHEFDAGFHTLRIEADYYNSVVEIEEGNNSYTCTIECDDNIISINGNINYKNFKDNTFYDARNIFIEIWDNNYPGNDVLVDTMWANSNGYFENNSIYNEDTDGLGGTLDIYLKYFARNEAAYSFDMSQPPDSCLYSESVYFSDVQCCNLYFSENVSSWLKAGAFFIIDQIKDARDTWIGLQPNSNLSSVGVYFRHFTTGYAYNDDVIIVDTSNNPINYSPDMFDKDIIIEEYGHKIEYECDFFDSSTGGPHSWFSRIDAGFASNEAFTYFWSCLVRNDSTKVNYFSNFQDSAIANLENGRYYLSGNYLGSVVDSGQLSPSSDIVEGNVACILWDIYDATDDDQNGDGYGDRASVSSSQILNVLTNDSANTIFQFTSDWINGGYGYNHEIWEACREQMNNIDSTSPIGSVMIDSGATSTTSLLVSLQLDMYDSISGLSSMRFSNDNVHYSVWSSFHSQVQSFDLLSFGGDSTFGLKTVYVQVSDSSSECNLWGPLPYLATAQINYIAPYICGDANSDGFVNIGDVTHLVNYIFKDGPPPIPMEAGNVNCDSVVNIGDTVYLINYVFKSGPAPCDCR